MQLTGDLTAAPQRIFMHALVIIGRTSAARDSSEAAIRGAAILGLSADEFATRVIGAAPVTVRESVDLDAVEAVRLQLVNCGIDAVVVESDGIQWHIELDGVTRGPVPLAWLESEVAAGRLDAEARVCRTTNPNWIPLASVVSESGPESESGPGGIRIGARCNFLGESQANRGQV